MDLNINRSKLLVLLLSTCTSLSVLNANPAHANESDNSFSASQAEVDSAFVDNVAFGSLESLAATTLEQISQMPDSILWPKSGNFRVRQYFANNIKTLSKSVAKEVSKNILKNRGSFTASLVASTIVDIIAQEASDYIIREFGYNKYSNSFAGTYKIITQTAGNIIISGGRIDQVAIGQVVILGETVYDVGTGAVEAGNAAIEADAADLRLKLVEAQSRATKRLASGESLSRVMYDYDVEISEIRKTKLRYMSVFTPFQRKDYIEYGDELIDQYDTDVRDHIVKFSLSLDSARQSIIEIEQDLKEIDVFLSSAPDEPSSASNILDQEEIIEQEEDVVSGGAPSVKTISTDELEEIHARINGEPSDEPIRITPIVSAPIPTKPIRITPIVSAPVPKGPTPEELAQQRRDREIEERRQREAEINDVVVPRLNGLSQRKTNLDVDIRNAENKIAAFKFHDLELVQKRLRDISPEIEALRDRGKGNLQLRDLARDQLKIQGEIEELDQLIQIRRNLSTLSLNDAQKAGLSKLAAKYGIRTNGGQSAWQRLLLSAESLINTRLDRARSNQTRIEEIGGAGPLSSAEQKRLQDLLREEEQLQQRQDEIARDIRDAENDLSDYRAELSSVEGDIHSNLKRLSELDPSFTYTSPRFTPDGIVDYGNYITTDRIGVPQAPSIPSQNSDQSQSPPSEDEGIDSDVLVADTSDLADEQSVVLGEASEPDGPMDPDPMLSTAPTAPAQLPSGSTIFSVATGVAGTEDFARTSDRSFGNTAGEQETLRFGFEPGVDTVFSTNNDRTAAGFSDLEWGTLPGFANAEFDGVVAPMQNTHWLYGNATDTSVLENRTGLAEFSGNVYGHLYDRATGSVNFDSVTGEIDLEFDFSANSLTGAGELGIDRGAQTETRNLTLVGSLSDDNVSTFRSVGDSSPSFDFDIGSTANVVAEVSTDNGGSGALVGGIFGENGSEFGGALSVFSEDDFITGVVTAASEQIPDPEPRRGNRLTSTAESPWDDLKGYVTSREADGRGGSGISNTSVQRYLLPDGSRGSDKSIRFNDGTVWTTGDQDEVYDFLEFGMSDVLNNLPAYEQAWWVYGSSSPVEQVESRVGSADFYGILRGDVTYTDFDAGAERKLFYDSTGGEVFLAIDFSDDSVSGSGEVFTDYNPDNAGISVRESFTVSGEMNSRPGLELDFLTTNTGPSQIQGDRDWIGAGSATTTFFGEDATELGGTFRYETEALGGTTFTGVIVAYDVDVAVEGSGVAGSPGDAAGVGDGGGDGTTGDGSGGAMGGSTSDTAAFVSTQNTSNAIANSRGAIDRIPVQGDTLATITIPPLDGGGTVTTTQVLAPAEYSHTQWGRWGANADTPSAFNSDGYFVAGNLTPASVVENRTGTASYSGGMIGDFVSGSGSRSSATGTIDLEANFTNQNVTGQMQFSHGSVNSPIASLNGGITNGSFSQTSTDHGFSGAFFGPSAEEVGGAAWMNANGGAYNGVFRAQDAVSAGAPSAGGAAGAGNGGNSF